MRKVEINGGIVNQTTTNKTILSLPATQNGYADAQFDDYGLEEGGKQSPDFLWQPGTTMTLKARFSHTADNLIGTAGFGFWNAPFADLTVRRLALPQATWFFLWFATYRFTAGSKQAWARLVCRNVGCRCVVCPTDGSHHAYCSSFESIQSCSPKGLA